jgi:hypothetical protein
MPHNGWGQDGIAKDMMCCRCGWCAQFQPRRADEARDEMQA